MQLKEGLDESQLIAILDRYREHCQGCYKYPLGFRSWSPDTSIHEVAELVTKKRR